MPPASRHFSGLALIAISLMDLFFAAFANQGGIICASEACVIMFPPFGELPNHSPLPMLLRLKSFLLVAFAYYVLATAGLLLAIPVGFASPVFPAAGVALAAVLALGLRVLPAIGLGSWAANLTFMGWNGIIDPTAAALAAGIGLGAASQAAAGRWIVLRFLGQRWRRLETEADIIRFMTLGGPLACWVSALIGVTLLVAGGLIPESERFNAWWNWFVGDTLGVLIARSEERRVGKECRRLCRSRWSPYH
jgi:integral membrane sensor domain MASE1